MEKNETDYTLKSGLNLKNLSELPELPPNSYTFMLKDEPIIIIDEVGFKYKGELIEDRGEVYKLFKEFLEQSKK